MLLWNTGRFDDITLETEDSPEGLIVRFVLTERRVIRSIHYTGNHSVSESEILDRFKERKVGLTVEQQYDPGRVQRAARSSRSMKPSAATNTPRWTRRSSRCRPPRWP